MRNQVAPLAIKLYIMIDKKDALGIRRLAAAKELEFLRQVKDRLRYRMGSLVCN